ncbi:hypothetical protein HK097_009340 [Rhizophlyctis rosea]|uniref:SH3 domain-containing protein n=1 Tax=Rhizophlyctis rosea TaxID=64517 RepID=A0AAD5X933_9FUNG|nr:hypothetical protein HK097_009340 [Rhizophlyctis rosea]
MDLLTATVHHEAQVLVRFRDTLRNLLRTTEVVVPVRLLFPWNGPGRERRGGAEKDSEKEREKVRDEEGYLVDEFGMPNEMQRRSTYLGRPYPASTAAMNAKQGAKSFDSYGQGRKGTVRGIAVGGELGNRSRPSLFKSKSGGIQTLSSVGNSMPALTERTSAEPEEADESMARGDITSSSEEAERAVNDVTFSLNQMHVTKGSSPNVAFAERLEAHERVSDVGRPSDAHDIHMRETSTETSGGLLLSAWKPSSPAIPAVRTSPLLGSPGSPGRSRKGTVRKDAFGNQYPVRCLRGYTPRLPDELALQAGDMVEIVETWHNGYALGRNLRTTDTGAFPTAILDLGHGPDQAHLKRSNSGTSLSSLPRSSSDSNLPSLARNHSRMNLPTTQSTYVQPSPFRLPPPTTSAGPPSFTNQRSPQQPYHNQRSPALQAYSGPSQPRTYDLNASPVPSSPSETSVRSHPGVSDYFSVSGRRVGREGSVERERGPALLARKRSQKGTVRFRDPALHQDRSPLESPITDVMEENEVEYAKEEDMNEYEMEWAQIQAQAKLNMRRMSGSVGGSSGPPSPGSPPGHSPQIRASSPGSNPQSRRRKLSFSLSGSKGNFADGQEIHTAQTRFAPPPPQVQIPQVREVPQMAYSPTSSRGRDHNERFPPVEMPQQPTRWGSQFRAVVDYRRRLDDEMELRVGDIVTLRFVLAFVRVLILRTALLTSLITRHSYEHGDGWAYGMNHSTSFQGAFPLNAVQPLSHPLASPSSPRSSSPSRRQHAGPSSIHIPAHPHGYGYA